MTLPAGLPAYPALARALRVTTERLAQEVAAPSRVAPGWSDLEWKVARASAVMQGTTVLLSQRLRWRGPDAWQQFLATQRQQALERDARIAALLQRIDVALRAVRAGCIALKGSALRRHALYGAGERPMGDIDLLAPREESAQVGRALEALDYECVSDVRRHRVYCPRAALANVHPGEHPDNPLKIEVHFRVAEPLPIRLVDITGTLIPEEEGCGLRDYANVRALFRHLMLHAAGNMRAHALRQIQLHDIALLAGRLSDEDWVALLSSPDAQGGAWWMWPVLDLARRYYPDLVPAIVDEFRGCTPAWLRRTSMRKTLTDLSWSNLRIAAFPGIYWSRSPREALHFMRSRVLPDRVALEELGMSSRTQPAMVKTVSWYGVSHARRIVRWMFSRPPRVQTVVSVQSALAAGERA